MSDKPVAMLVTAAVVAPICSLCVLGPAFLFSWLGGLVGGLNPVVATGLAIVGAILVYGFFSRRKSRRAQTGTVDVRDSHGRRRMRALDDRP